VPKPPTRKPAIKPVRVSREDKNILVVHYEAAEDLALEKHQAFAGEVAKAAAVSWVGIAVLLPPAFEPVDPARAAFWRGLVEAKENRVTGVALIARRSSLQARAHSLAIQWKGFRVPVQAFVELADGIRWLESLVARQPQRFPL
jgi:hypothetical protein